MDTATGLVTVAEPTAADAGVYNIVFQTVVDTTTYDHDFVLTVTNSCDTPSIAIGAPFPIAQFDYFLYSNCATHATWTDAAATLTTAIPACSCGNIVWDVTFADGSPITAPFTVNTATSPYTISVCSSDVTDVQTWNLKISATLDSGVALDTPAESFFDVRIINPCVSAVITLTNFDRQ